MTQADAEKMSNEQAVAILTLMAAMMCDQYGCPISDAYFALEKAIDVLTATDVEPIRHGRWVDENGDTVRMIDGVPEKSCWCGSCGEWLVGSDANEIKGHYCPNCGARMDEVDVK